MLQLLLQCHYSYIPRSKLQTAYQWSLIPSKQYTHSLRADVGEVCTDSIHKYTQLSHACTLFEQVAIQV